MFTQVYHHRAFEIQSSQGVITIIVRPATDRMIEDGGCPIKGHVLISITYESGHSVDFDNEDDDQDLRNALALHFPDPSEDILHDIMYALPL